MNKAETQDILKAGKIASQVRENARKFIKKDMLLLEIAEKIEDEIIKLGAKPAFPVNLSINEISAHYTPSHDDKNLAGGLLKIDIGVHINGYVADTAFSVDLEDSEENKKLIRSAEKALNSAVKICEIKKSDATLAEIGGKIHEAMEEDNCTPIGNLSGHSIEKYNLHSGLTIPNIKNNQQFQIGQGLIAIEPFSTLKQASGKVYDGKLSGIYQLLNNKPVRNPVTREILKYIESEYQTLPFCERWLYKKFSNKTLIALKELENNGNLHHYPRLIEFSHKPVAQAEHTLLIEKDRVIVTTE